jgi:hypothetical protein
MGHEYCTEIVDIVVDGDQATGRSYALNIRWDAAVGAALADLAIAVGRHLVEHRAGQQVHRGLPEALDHTWIRQ